MLSLVRSQHACIERIRSAVRWAKRLVVLVGAPGQGKTVVIQDLVLRTPTNPLCLEGELISDRTDAVLRLVGLVGLRPEGSMHEMLARLQTKHSAGSEQGIPEIIVDDAHCLPDAVLQLFHELTVGAYGRRWSVLLVGEDQLVSRLQTLQPKAVLCSVVMLPPWDQQDLEQAGSKIYPGQEWSSIPSSVLQRYGSQPKQLLRLVDEWEDSAVFTPDLPEHEAKVSMVRLSSSWLIGFGFALVVLIAVLIFVQLSDEKTPARTSTPIPLTPQNQ